MRSVILPLGSLLFATLLLLAGNGLLTTVVALQMSRANFAAAAVGIVMTAYYAGFTAGGLYADRIVRNVGHIRAFASFAAAAAATALMHAVVPIGWQWGVLRAVSGFAMAGLFMSIESWLNAASSNETRGRVIAVYLTVVYSGLGTGQILLNAWAVGDLRLFALIGLLMCLAVLPVALTRTPAPSLGIHQSLSIVDLFRRARLGVAAACAGGAMGATIYAVAPIYAEASGFDTRGTSLFMSALIFGGLFLQWPLGRLSDRFDRRYVLFGLHVAIAMVAGICALPSLDPGAARSALAALFGGLVFSVYGIALTYVFDRVERPSFLAANAAIVTISAFGAIAGPLSASVSMTWLGPKGLFVTDALIALVIAGLALLDVRTLAPVPQAEREVFVTVPRTTAVAAELDPRAAGAESGES